MELPANNTSGTSTTVSEFSIYFKRERAGVERFAGWWMGRIAGRYCPCEWPIRIRWLLRLCGRLDDIEARYQNDL